MNEHIVAIWEAGKAAPYSLFESRRIIDGVPVLVEAIAGGNAPLIARGDIISVEVAARVKAQLQPPPLPPVMVEVLVRDEEGNPTYTAEGEPVVEMQMIQPDREISTLSYLEPDPEENCCDMCGNPRAELFQIGSGWYCKVDRTPAGGGPDTCFNIRLGNMA